jgi:uncharacterized protein YndB with AHSA1/START domain
MNEINFQIKEIYPHPIKKVWESITTQTGLEAWLMPNDFKLIKGYECTFRFCSTEEDEQDSQVMVRIVEFAAPCHMVWHWRNDGEPEDSTVTFTLREVDGGTELTLQHTGPVADRLARELMKGWPTKLGALQVHLGKVCQ